MTRASFAKKTSLALLLAGVIALCSEVEAAHGIKSLAVSALVRNSCTANTDADLDGHHVVATASVSATGEVSVDCSIHTPYSVALNTGTVKGASVTRGDTTTAANSFSYNLFRDGAYVAPWGTAAGPDALSGTYAAQRPAAPVYGRLTADHPNAANPDLLTMSVNY